MKSLTITFESARFPQFNEGKPACRTLINGKAYVWAKSESDALLTAIAAFTRELDNNQKGESNGTD